MKITEITNIIRNKMECLQDKIKFEIVTWKLIDVILFFVFVPIGLFLFFFLPVEWREQFTLNLKYPTIVTMFLSNFGHTNYEHYKGNITSYIILLFLLFNIETNRKRFYIVSILFFFILPFVISIASILRPPYEQIQNSIGFSGIVSAYLGYLVVAVYYRLKEDYGVDVNHLFIAMFFVIAFTTWIVSNPVSTVSLKLIFVISTIVLIWLNKHNIRKILEIIKEKRKKLKNTTLKNFSMSTFIFAMTLMLLVIPFYFLVPLLFKSPNPPNWVAHYVGYCFGILVGLVLDIGVIRYRCLRRVMPR